MNVAQNIPAPLENDDNGYNAWLNYQLESNPDRLAQYKEWLSAISGDLTKAAKEELERSISIIAGIEPVFTSTPSKVHFAIDGKASELGKEGYSIESENGQLTISSKTEAGSLYATFSLIEALQLGKPLDTLCMRSLPANPIRMLNHWDDPKFDHTLGPYNVTRGFAGNSIFLWDNLLEDLPRYKDYARILASIGVNAVCLNNVNADPDMLETEYLPGIKAMADRFRPYNIKVYLAIPFTAPMVCDGEKGEDEYGPEYPFCMRNRKVRHNTLDTADPEDPQVQEWWKRKADEIYALIPDFGGYVIKASSEGMPGPQDFGRSHVEGANTIARSLKEHEGILFYRTFVYEWAKDPKKVKVKRDACCQAFEQFQPLDGNFDDNVIIQTKCGPADFRSHEPPNPLLGALPQSRQAIEFMIAQEYLGYTTHICFQGGDWSNTLNFDTKRKGNGSTVASAVNGQADGYSSGAIVGVANFGDDPNWFGHLFAGANMYAFGKLAWDASANVEAIVSDWSARTLKRSSSVQAIVVPILMESYDIYAKYTVPLGMNIMHESCHHFEPDNEKLTPSVWNPTGAGYDRTSENGSGYVQLYEPEAGKHWKNPETTPVNQLLFFHHLPWDYKLGNGKALSEYIRDDRIEAVECVLKWVKQWQSLRDELPPQIWAHVNERLHRQYVHAGKWRDAGLKALERVQTL